MSAPPWEDPGLVQVPPPEEAWGPPDDAPRNPLSSKLLSRDQLATLPAPSPLIDNVLDLGTVAVLAGYWGTLKSFIAQDWASCIATGKPWQHRAVQRRRVLYIAAEGAHGLDGRLNAWELAGSTQIPNGDLSVLPTPVKLTDAAETGALGQVISDGGYGVVVIDTLARCLFGADENSAGDMGRVVHHLYQLQAATPDGAGTVLGVHHTGKDRSTIRGSSALESGVDTVYQTDGDAAFLTLTRTKRKDGPAADRHTLQLDTISEIGGAYLVHAGADTTGGEQKLMSIFMSAFSTTGATKADLRNAAEMPPATFHRAVNGLVDKGLLANSGTDKQPFYKAVAM